MTIWIWEELDGLTNNYHTEGTAVVIADGWEQAVRLLRAAASTYFTATDEELATPTHVYHPGLHSGAAVAHIYPNAGCC